MGFGKRVAKCMEYGDYNDSRLSPPREKCCPDCGQELERMSDYWYCHDCEYEWIISDDRPEDYI